MGPVHVTLDRSRPTRGEIEEQVNNTRGILDVKPFTPTGQAASFFDVFYEIRVGEQVFHPRGPIHMVAVITHRPPAPGDTYVNPFNEPVELLDANGNPTGIKLLREVHTPNPEKEIDDFPRSLALVTMMLPSGQTETIRLVGPTKVVVGIPPSGMAADTDGDGLDQVSSEMTELLLRGKSAMGEVILRLAGRAPGEIEETSNKTPGTLDIPPFVTPDSVPGVPAQEAGRARSSFDIPIEMIVNNQVYHLAKPLRMETIITHKPPRPRDRYVNPFTEPVDVLDANGQPTGIKLVREVHIPDPRVTVRPVPGQRILEIRFPARGTGVVLQQTGDLFGGFRDVTVGIVEEEGEQKFTLDPQQDRIGFFRFKMPE